MILIYENCIGRDCTFVLTVIEGAEGGAWQLNYAHRYQIIVCYALPNQHKVKNQQPKIVHDTKSVLLQHIRRTCVNKCMAILLLLI
jgi:hypothetical protein